MYILLNWLSLENIYSVMDENGTTIIFNSWEDADNYAKYLNFEYQIIKVG